ncbi:MAG: hypothetical protein KC917_02585 [Candidatus Omnitrophica bacterium]|nr:hypothetical protein [Candidatus Omnitrophota bacterium]
MKTFAQILVLVIVSIGIGLSVNALAPESLPLVAPESQFEVAVPDEQKVAHSEIVEYFESGEAIFVDARGADAFTEGHIPGAFSIPYKEFEDGNVPEKVELLPKEMTVVVYCDGADCHASKEVADHLLELGFQPDLVKVFHGGWKEWLDNGGEVESGEPL